MEKNDTAENIYETLVHTLKKEGLTLSCAESLTGGLIAASVVDIPGASKVFRGGLVTYCDEAKHSLLKVPEETLEKYGAISEETAREMAAGAAAALKTDMAVSSTGNAGPDADEGKPVGLAFVGIFYKGNVQAFRLQLSGTRAEIRRQVASRAAEFALEVLASKNPPA